MTHFLFLNIVIIIIVVLSDIDPVTEYHKITIENKTNYTLRVRADSERIIEKRVSSQKSAVSKNAYDAKNYERTNEENSNSQHSYSDNFSDKFTDKHSDIFRHDSGVTSTSKYNSDASSQDTNVKAKGSYGVFSAEASTGHKSDKSSESSSNIYNKHSNTDENIRDSKRGATQHTISDDGKTETIRKEKESNNEEKFENESNFHNEFSAEYEYTFIDAGYAEVGPLSSVCLVTKKKLAYVTISAFMELEKSSDEKYLWKNQQTVDDHLKVEINKVTNKPQVSNIFDKNILNSIGLTQFIPKFQQLGWTDTSLWNQMNDEDFKEIGFKKAHKLIFKKYRDQQRFGYQMEWNKFRNEIKDIIRSQQQLKEATCVATDLIINSKYGNAQSTCTASCPAGYTVISGSCSGGSWRWYVHQSYKHKNGWMCYCGTDDSDESKTNLYCIGHVYCVQIVDS
eukprot:423539_1